MIESTKISFKADLKRMFDRGLLPSVKKGFYGASLNLRNVTREHLLPASKGGLRIEENIVLADKVLNNERGVIPIWRVANKLNAVEYLKQFRDISVPQHKFNGNNYIKAIVRTLKRLGLDLTQDIDIKSSRIDFKA